MTHDSALSHYISVGWLVVYLLHAGVQHGTWFLLYFNVRRYILISTQFRANNHKIDLNNKSHCSFPCNNLFCGYNAINAVTIVQTYF